MGIRDSILNQTDPLESEDSAGGKMRQDFARRQDSTDSRDEKIISAAQSNRPSPCIFCGGLFFWVDAYLAVHCSECEPEPKSRSLFRGRLVVVASEETEGDFEWELFSLDPKARRLAVVDPGWSAEPNCGERILRRYDFPRLINGPRQGEPFDQWWERVMPWTDFVMSRKNDATRPKRAVTIGG